MVKLLNKYEAVRICDRCGNEQIVLKAHYNNLIKQSEHICSSCRMKERDHSIPKKPQKIQSASYIRRYHEVNYNQEPCYPPCE